MKNMRQLINLMEGVVAVPGVGVEEGARPGTYEVPTAWRKAQGQAPLTPQDVQRHDYEDKISSKETLAKNTGRTPTSEGAPDDGSHAGEWAMMRFNELTNSFVDPEEAMSTVMRELQSQGASAEDLEDAQSGIMSLFSGEQGLDVEPEGSYDMSDDADALASAGHGSDEDYGNHGEEFEEDFDLNNGYDDIDNANGEDFFPNGADSPVVKAVGPSGARQGDNPEQKKMQVAEVHKELVYGYRNYLKESSVQEGKTYSKSASGTARLQKKLNAQEKAEAAHREKKKAPPSKESAKIPKKKVD